MLTIQALALALVIALLLLLMFITIEKERTPPKRSLEEPLQGSGREEEYPAKKFKFGEIILQK